MNKSFQIEINGKNHTIEYKDPYVYINRNKITVKSFSKVFNIFDYEFIIDDVVCHLIVGDGKETRLAVNGVYTDNNEEYKPHFSIPKWVDNLCRISIYFAFCLGIFKMFSQGALSIFFNVKSVYYFVISLVNIIIGLNMAMKYVRFAFEGNLSKIKIYFIWTIIQILATLLLIILI